ncbi:MAG: hypothetical protein KDA58_06885 [Planctomycetaceae bacterium]|nr:hypothetical protein [Planctomycetaceae bacterium]
MARLLLGSLCGLLLFTQPGFAEEAIPIEKPEAAATEAKEVDPALLLPSHKQVRSVKPLLNGQPTTLNTFCLSPEGDIVCCVGGSRMVPKVNDDGEVTLESDGELTSGVVIYSPEGELKQTIKTPFKPTAVNFAPDGTFFVAGDGKIQHLTTEGKVLADSTTPNIGDLEEFKAKAVEAAKKQAEQYQQMFAEQLEQLETKIAEIEETPEEERTAVEKARLKAMTRQQEMYSQQVDMISKQFGAQNTDAAFQRASRVTALAVTNGDVFVCCTSSSGRGYEVWRTGHDLKGGEVVLESLSGCCGQMDIQAQGENLYVAENTKFRVGVYSRDGELQNSFGSRDRNAPEGFGSCCNPMNVRCCPNGDVLAAESSIGNIKRFNAEGEFVGLIGKARIGGGCKHVAVGFDPQRDYYYMMNVDKGHVCVLVPLAEAPEFTEEELAAKQAKEGLGKKLVGTWELVTETKQPKREGLSGVLSSLLGGASSEGSNLMFTKGTFGEDGTLKISGGQYGQLGSTRSLGWVPVRQEENKLYFATLMDGVEFYSFCFEFTNDDEVTLSMMYSDQVMATKPFRRTEVAVGDEPADQPKSVPAVRIQVGDTVLESEAEAVEEVEVTK